MIKLWHYFGVIKSIWCGNDINYLKCPNEALKIIFIKMVPVIRFNRQFDAKNILNRFRRAIYSPRMSNKRECMFNETGIVIGNGIGVMSSNPGRGWLRFAWPLVEAWITLFSSQIWGKILDQTVFFSLGLPPGLVEGKYWIQACSPPLKNWPCVMPASYLQNSDSNSLNFLSHRVISLFDTHLLLVGVTSAPNSTRLHSRLSPDISDLMNLLFTQVHFLFDSSTGSEVNTLHILTLFVI